jgi:hypothetical protein
MKYYCIEDEMCGFFDHTDDMDIHKELICPICYSPLLVYRDDEFPDWTDWRNSQRPDGRDASG